MEYISFPSFSMHFFLILNCLEHAIHVIFFFSLKHCFLSIEENNFSSPPPLPTPLHLLPFPSSLKYETYLNDPFGSVLPYSILGSLWCLSRQFLEGDNSVHFDWIKKPNIGRAKHNFGGGWQGGERTPSGMFKALRTPWLDCRFELDIGPPWLHGLKTEGNLRGSGIRPAESLL